MPKNAVRGTCKLCLQDKELLRSHFMPSQMYAFIRRSLPSVQDHPVVMGKGVTSMTALQVRDYLLCADCEDRFNKNGESYALRWMWNGSNFPLYDRLILALPDRLSNQYASFSATKIGIATDKLGYFALSVLWRAGIHTWSTPFGGKSNRMNLGEFEEPIRHFLLDIGPFPEDVAVILTVCSDAKSQHYFYMPQSVTNMPPLVAFSSLCLGIHFMIVTVKNLPDTFRESCCVSSERHPIWMRDCAQKTAEALVQFEGSRVVGKFAGK